MSEALATLLGPINSLPEIGEEILFIQQDNIRVYCFVEETSWRLVDHVNDVPVSALQIVTHDGKIGQAARAYTLPEYRRKGHAKRLLNYARKFFTEISPSTQLSDDGYAWTKAMWPRFDVDRALFQLANEHFKRLPFIKGCASGIDSEGTQILPVIRIGMEDKVSELPEKFNHIRVFPRFEKDD